MKALFARALVPTVSLWQAALRSPIARIAAWRFEESSGLNPNLPPALMNRSVRMVFF